SLRQSMFI
ncbi:ribulose-phosphate 3 epimerase family protein, partial [Vibrio parahaemolyticus V-223/04]